MSVQEEQTERRKEQTGEVFEGQRGGGLIRRELPVNAVNLFKITSLGFSAAAFRDDRAESRNIQPR